MDYSTIMHPVAYAAASIARTGNNATAAYNLLIGAVNEGLFGMTPASWLWAAEQAIIDLS